MRHFYFVCRSRNYLKNIWLGFCLVLMENVWEVDVLKQGIKREEGKWVCLGRVKQFYQRKKTRIVWSLNSTVTQNPFSPLFFSDPYRCDTNFPKK